MYTSNLLPIALLSLPLLSSAIPQEPPADAPVVTSVPQPTPENPQPSSANPEPTTTQQPTTTLTPSQRNGKFIADYNALISAAATIPAYQALATGLTAGAVPASIANAQEQSYINLLKSATAPVPEPAYITGLPQDQQSWVRSFHLQLQSVAAADLGAAPVATTSTAAPTGSVQAGNGTEVVSNGTTSVAQPSSTVAVPSGTDVPIAVPEQPPVNGTNGTNTTSGAEGLGAPRGNVWSMAAAGVVGVMGVMVLL
ncbi:MAG: hypothetical protein Q9186_007355 [Xanthomendoza sp. 1 TL-2023]